MHYGSISRKSLALCFRQEGGTVEEISLMPEPSPGERSRARMNDPYREGSDYMPSMTRLTLPTEEAAVLSRKEYAECG